VLSMRALIKTSDVPCLGSAPGRFPLKRTAGIPRIHALPCTALCLLILLLLLHADTCLCQETDEPDYSTMEGRPILRIEISGNKKTREYVILRELMTNVGDTLSLAIMRIDEMRLTKLSAFSKIEITPRLEDDAVIYAVKVSETAFVIPTILPGYSEENGWYFGPMVSTPNWFGRAILASVYAQWGGITKYSFSANNPWISVAHRQLSVSVGTTYQKREDKIRESEETTYVSAVRGTFYPGRNRIFSVGLGFQYMLTKSDKPGVTLSPSNRDHLPQFELLMRANSIEDPLDPHYGWVTGIQERRIGGFLGGEGDSWRTQVDVTRYQPLSPRSTLAIGGVFDHQTGRVGEDIPIYLQYSLGGSNSIRGYSRTDLGKVLYGKNQLLGTIEFSYCIMSPRQIQLLGLSFLSFRLGMNIIGFVDHGVAWTESGELNLDRSKTGYGVGLHLMVPGIDRIRLDLGFSQDGDVMVHLGTRAKFDAHR
jgi:outer membrane protein insertion porin family